MDYASTYSYSRHNCRVRTATTTAVTRPNRRVSRLVATSERPQPNTLGQTTIRTERPFADGFLKSRFLPKLQVNPDLKTLSDEQIKQRERDFFGSLSQLADYYGFAPTETAHFGYPYNLMLAYRDTEKRLKQSHKSNNFNSLQISENDDTGQIFLSVTEIYDTQQHFYYLPVIPLFRMLNDTKRTQTAQLLLSVCSYLYRIAGIPFYRQENSFLYWQYDMLKQWATHDDDSEESREILAELTQAEQIGDHTHTLIFSKENLTQWKQRIKTFQAKDSFDSEVFLMVTKFFQLYKNYPKRSLFQYITADWEETEYFYDDEETKITMDKYVGFIADDKGVLYEQLCETVNQEFSQYGDIEEPTVTTHFDGTPIGKDNLDFENRIFPLINELCYYLHQYNTQENEREHK